MPTSATHITIVQRLALEPKYAGLLGNPLPEDPADTQAVQDAKDLNRFACLGAVGPDFLYALLDYGAGLQALEDFAAKTAGTFHCFGELMGQINRLVDGELSLLTDGLFDSLEATVGLLTGVVKEGFLAAIVSAGFNPWPWIQPRRETDQPRSAWFWADYLHYVRTGKFAQKLLDNAAGNDKLMAYAAGYGTHYVTDTVGHPFVNEVVGAPWRLAWQRHHLVENFIDTYVWDRWHVQSPEPQQPSAEERPADIVFGDLAQRPASERAPLTSSRLNDLVEIGLQGAPDPFQSIVTGVCESIGKGLFDFGVPLDPMFTTPNDADFVAWTKLIEQTLHDVYADDHPTNLGNGGFPTADDIGAAYMMFRFLLSMTTEENVPEPVPPDVTGDIEQALQQLEQKIAQDLGQIGPPPLPSSSGSFSFENALKSLEQLAEWAVNATEAVAEAVFDTLKGLADLATDATAVELAKTALWLLDTALFGLYRHFRDVLVINAYVPPFTDELSTTNGGLSLDTLWTLMGPPPSSYPGEELQEATKTTGSSYNPTVPNGPTMEQPATTPGPYAGHVVISNLSPGGGRATPDVFIDDTGPISVPQRDGMFTAGGPLPFDGKSSFGPADRLFGNAMDNCRTYLDLVLGGFGDAVLPDYNLDGDRGYAWPCWDVQPGTFLDPFPPHAPARNPVTAEVQPLQ